MIELDINRIVVLILMGALMYALYTYQQELPNISIPFISNHFNNGKINERPKLKNKKKKSKKKVKYTEETDSEECFETEGSFHDHQNHKHRKHSSKKKKKKLSKKSKKFKPAKEINFDLLSIDNISNASIGSLLEVDSEYNAMRNKRDQLSDGNSVGTGITDLIGDDDEENFFFRK
jgi:hypothetical protein